MYCKNIVLFHDFYPEENSREQTIQQAREEEKSEKKNKKTEKNYSEQNREIT